MDVLEHPHVPFQLGNNLGRSHEVEQKIMAFRLLLHRVGQPADAPVLPLDADPSAFLHDTVQPVEDVLLLAFIRIGWKDEDRFVSPIPHFPSFWSNGPALYGGCPQTAPGGSKGVQVTHQKLAVA